MVDSRQCSAVSILIRSCFNFNGVNVIHVSEGERMGLIILPQLLFLFFVTVGGHNINRIGSADEDCDLRSNLISVKKVLEEEVLEKCSTDIGSPDGEFIISLKFSYSLF